MNNQTQTQNTTDLAGQLDAAIDVAKMDVVRAIIEENPEFTLGDLVKANPRFGHLRVHVLLNRPTPVFREEIRRSPQEPKNTVLAVVGGESKPPASATNSKPGQKNTTSQKHMPLSTTAQKAAYSAAILKFLDAQEKPMKSRHIRKKVGGDPEQLRRALDPLLKAKRVKRTGERITAAYTTPRRFHK